MYLNLCPYFFIYVEKQLDQKAQVKFKIYDIENWEINNFSTHIVQYLKKAIKMKFVQFTEYNMRNNFLEKSCIM